jgi:uncharacterized tellurite resistance protein B-like protein
MAEPREEFEIEELKHIADILMGAAYADGVHEIAEASAIRRVLAELAGGAALPEAVSARLEAFDVGAFRLEESCAKLQMGSPERRRCLLQLVAQVTESDEIHDFDETDYIVRVAQCIGASRAEYEGLTVDVRFEDADRPPPVPEDRE